MQQKAVAFEEQSCYNDVASKERCVDTGQKNSGIVTRTHNPLLFCSDNPYQYMQSLLPMAILAF